MIINKDVYVTFKLCLNIDKFGTYVRGDVMTITIPVLDENNGLCRYPIPKHWTIIGKTVVNEKQIHVLGINKDGDLEKGYYVINVRGFNEPALWTGNTWRLIGSDKVYSQDQISNVISKLNI